MKVAVYTIAKNEEQFVESWAESAKDADLILIADTGSDDSTIELARKAGCEVVSISISPWRFDDARNAALAYIPEDFDYCISLDADEVLAPGWRDAIEGIDPDATRIQYKYVWSWNEDGSEGIVFGADKIHQRYGYRWKHPVHETLVCSEEVEENIVWCDGLEMYHYPDSRKIRTQYLHLLELATKEDPSCDRMSHYLGREYMYHGLKKEAKQELKRHLSLSSAQWEPERAASMQYIARCADNPQEAEYWLLHACAEAPNRREPWVSIASHYHALHFWGQCYAAATRALNITEKPLDYLCEPFAWGAHVYDLAAISAWNLGLTAEAFTYGQTACRISPSDERLEHNLKFYQQAVA